MAFLSFSLGPVQPFIAAARTVRDLWTGSYLLSFLTFGAMRPILENGDRDRSFVLPTLENLPLWRLMAPGSGPVADRPLDESLLLPCIPNTFIAVVDREVADARARECEAACRTLWRGIAEDVRRQLDDKIRSCADLAAYRDGWDRLWTEQIDSFFEIHTVILPWRMVDRAVLEQWLPSSEMRAGDKGVLWDGRLKLLFRLMQAERSVRHVPSYFPDGPVPQKCSILGSYEQVGPPLLGNSRAFWQLMSQFCRHGGTRTSSGERLCAVSLVKRYAWTMSLSARLDIQDKSLGRYSDTATVAARVWLKNKPELDPATIWKDGYWSGQWLHWKSQNEGVKSGEDPVPDGVWKRIAAKKIPGHPPLPSYYAILTVDGDRMGRWLRGESCGVEDLSTIQNTISAALTRFAVCEVPAIVRDHDGELIYSGGDDVLALLPNERVLQCARQLCFAYKKNWPGKDLCAVEKATVSAGIAVVHFKEDLRFALNAARAAEKAAKEGGRDAVGLTVCRRSGEHTTALVAWEALGTLQELVLLFLKGASDRWTYVLRQELPTLAGDQIPDTAFEAELLRVLKRVDDPDHQKLLKDLVLGLFSACNVRGSGVRGLGRERKLEGFVTLCQSSSFLARGRDW